MSTESAGEWTLDHLERCFEGAIPAVLATASADGVPNVAYLSRAHRVDDRHLALSNQFLSKTARNLAEHPYASLLLMDVVTHDEFRLSLRYVRTERRGRVFDRLRHDVEAIASLTGMQDVFRLRAADVFEVLAIEQVPPHPDRVDVAPLDEPRRSTTTGEVAALLTRLGQGHDLDDLVATAVDGLADLLGFRHVQLLLLDESGERLYTIASRGYPQERVGSEVAVGDDIVGTAAARCRPVRVGNLKQMRKYSATVQRAFAPGERDIPTPRLEDADSRMAVPAVALGQLVGVVVVDSPRPVAFTDDDEAVVVIVASQLAHALEALRGLDVLEEASRPGTNRPGGGAGTVHVRAYADDGSVFVDGEYLIKGVAGRLLRLLLHEHLATGRTEFTNREVRLHPSLGMPGYRDNFESRLLLLKRRLAERGGPLRVEGTARGRFRLELDAPVRLEDVEA